MDYIDDEDDDFTGLDRPEPESIEPPDEEAELKPPSPKYSSKSGTLLTACANAFAAVCQNKTDRKSLNALQEAVYFYFDDCLQHKQVESDQDPYIDRVFFDSQGSVMARIMNQAQKPDAAPVKKGYFVTAFNRGFSTYSHMFATRKHIPLQSYDTPINASGGTLLDTLRIADTDAEPMHISDARLQKHLVKLPPAQQDALLLLAEGKNYQEIADTMGLPLNRVKNNIYHGRTNMMKELKNSGDLDQDSYFTHIATKRINNKREQQSDTQTR